MDKLKIGSAELNGDVYVTSARVEGMTVPALELRVEGPVERSVLDALKKCKLEIWSGDGVRQGEYEGYHTVCRHSIVVAKVSDAQQELAETRTALEALKAEKAALESEHAALLYETLTGEAM